MSSWGYRTFEDGIACDWLEDLHGFRSDRFFCEVFGSRPGSTILIFSLALVLSVLQKCCVVSNSGPRAGLPDVCGGLV